MVERMYVISILIMILSRCYHAFNRECFVNHHVSKALDYSTKLVKFNSVFELGMNKGREFSKLPRVYIDMKLGLDEHCFVDEENSHYIMNVMRMKKGSNLRVFNGKQGEFLAQIVDIPKKHAKSVELNVLSLIRTERSHINPVILFFAPIKKTRMKILLEKATELGIDLLVPVITQNTNADLSIKDIESYRRILIESSEQCERLTVPVLHEKLKLQDLLNGPFAANILSNSEEFRIEKLLVCRERESDQVTMKKRVPILKALESLSYFREHRLDNSDPVRFALLCGPEGGFTQPEWEMMESCKNLEFISLGDTILRAETAAISALSCISCYMEFYEHKKSDHP